MKASTELQIAKAAYMKAYRAAIRLKYSLDADAEVARTLPVVEERIDKALSSGQGVDMNPGSVFYAEIENAES
jgi:hypothetical protein